MKIEILQNDVRQLPEQIEFDPFPAAKWTVFTLLDFKNAPKFALILEKKNAFHSPTNLLIPTFFFLRKACDCPSLSTARNVGRFKFKLFSVFQIKIAQFFRSLSNFNRNVAPLTFRTSNDII